MEEGLSEDQYLVHESSYLDGRSRNHDLRKHAPDDLSFEIQDHLLLEFLEILERDPGSPVVPVWLGRGSPSGAAAF